MTMTRKDYRIIAEAIREVITEGEHGPHGAQGAAQLARKLADGFKRSNTAFRYDKFFPACGLDAWGEIKEGNE